MQTLYASFLDISLAEKAAGALIDHGVKGTDISLVAADRSNALTESETHVRTGITTTTPADVAAGARRGARIGLGLGTVAAVASLLVPGVGFVTGGGALASALLGAIGTTAAGALSGGVLVLLKDQGVPEHVATRYQDAIKNGGALLAVALPESEIEQGRIRQIISKYDGRDWSTHRDPTFRPFQSAIIELSETRQEPVVQKQVVVERMVQGGQA